MGVERLIYEASEAQTQEASRQLHYLLRNFGAGCIILGCSYLAIIQHDRLNAADEAGRSFHLRRIHVGRRRAAQIEVQR